MPFPTCFLDAPITNFRDLTHKLLRFKQYPEGIYQKTDTVQNDKRLREIKSTFYERIL